MVFSLSFSDESADWIKQVKNSAQWAGSSLGDGRVVRLERKPVAWLGVSLPALKKARTASIQTTIEGNLRRLLVTL